ncbi:MAG TPA: cytochrome C oxidase subunit IV family protein [Candidatus Paceibacterota bacterium]|nr:cytochrome C oxidase subunit IV family protein [Candidatus Paceibacterota bacterium]
MAKQEGSGAMLKYAIGFILSVILTVAAYTLVLIHISSEHETISHPVLLAAILTLAVTQLVVQLIFFLHVGAGRGSGWKTLIFISTFVFVLLIVLGSIWIMNHLNYNMTPDQVSHYLQTQQGGF